MTSGFRIWNNLQGLDKDLTEVREAVEAHQVAVGTPAVRVFERALENSVSSGGQGKTHVLATITGTAALHAILSQIHAPSKVIVPTITWWSTINAILDAGHIPVILDVDPDYGMLTTPGGWPYDMDRWNQHSNAKLGAIIIVHLHGNVCYFDPAYRTQNALLIEDAAQAQGSIVSTPRSGCAGALGDAAIFSFNGNKVITTGQGGAILTQYESFHEGCASFIDHCKSDETEMKRGNNYRMAGLNAAFGLTQLHRLPHFLDARWQNHQHYCYELEDLIVRDLAGQRPNHWGIMLQHPLAHSLHDELIRRGIQSRLPHKPLHLQPRYAEYSDGSNYAGSDEYWSKHIMLPSGSNLTESEISEVCETVKEQLGCLS